MDRRTILDSAMTNPLRDVIHDLRRRWKPLLLTNLLFKFISLIVLTPLMALAFRGFISISGNGMLADADIVHFLLTFEGLICLIVVSAIALAIVALEMATLMGVLAFRPDSQHVVLDSLRLALFKAWPVFRLAARIVAMALVITAPFLAVAGLVYFGLLGEFDINYYLKTRPPNFKLAVGIGGILLLGLTAALIFATSGWLLALPLVLFEDASPAKALRISRERTSGSRWTLIRSITVWAIAILVLSSSLTSVVVLIGRLFIDRTVSSLSILALAIGMSLIASLVINAIVNFIGTATFASLLFHSYRTLGNPQMDQITEQWDSSPRSNKGIRITAARVSIGLVVGVMVAALIGYRTVSQIPLDNDIQVIAHRGASASAPENTLAAVRQAIEEGTDWVEIDVQETADGQVVVFHDSDFMKLSGVNRKIWEVTADELEAIDVGASFSESFRGERVPTLAQVLDLCRGRAKVNIELKYYGHDQQLEQRVIELVESQQMSQDVVFMSLKQDAVKKMKSLKPNWDTGLLLSVAIGDKAESEANFLAMNARFASRSMVRKTHQLGKQVFVWTVNDPITMAVMIGRGVDGLITDKPALAREVIAERSQLNAAERMLLELAAVFGITPEITQQQ
jgi:glycerophosphoryl diester phosphodiesterase